MKRLEIKNKKALFITSIILILISAAYTLYFSFNSRLLPIVIINDTKIDVEIVDSFESRRQGLSNRESLDKNSGMFFVFEDKQPRSFWMKNMNFPIDIIWISDNKIIKIDENLEGEGDHPINHYNSGLPVNYVLEVNAGFSFQNGIKVADFVKIIN